MNAEDFWAWYESLSPGDRLVVLDLIGERTGEATSEGRLEVYERFYEKKAEKK